MENGARRIRLPESFVDPVTLRAMRRGERQEDAEAPPGAAVWRGEPPSPPQTGRVLQGSAP